jgi:hypothetical protein
MFAHAFFTSRETTALSLDYSPGLDLRHLFPRLGGLVRLSLANCSLDISEVFDLLASVELSRLEALNLSGNTCHHIVGRITTLPVLSTLTVNKVRWDDGCLLSFFGFVFEAFPRGFDLSIARFQASQHEQQDVSSFFVASKLTPLTGLIWDRNPIDAGFFDLLRKSPRLLSLSVSRCFSELNPTFIYQFAAYLRTAKLTSFSIASRKSQYLGRFLGCIVSALESDCFLEFLDISGSRCGDEGIAHIRQLLQAGNLKVVDFDGIHPASVSLFFDLLALVPTLPYTKVSYPAVDLEELASRNFDIGPAKAHFEIRRAGDPGRPFMVFRCPERRQFLPLWSDVGVASPNERNDPRALADEQPRRRPEPLLGPRRILESVHVVSQHSDRAVRQGQAIEAPPNLAVPRGQASSRRSTERAIPAPSAAEAARFDSAVPARPQRDRDPVRDGKASWQRYTAPLPSDMESAPPPRTARKRTVTVAPPRVPRVIRVPIKLSGGWEMPTLAQYQFDETNWDRKEHVFAIDQLVRLMRDEDGN